MYILLFEFNLDQQLLIVDSLIATNGMFNSRDFSHRLRKWYNNGYPELDNKPPFGIGEENSLIPHKVEIKYEVSSMETHHLII